MKIVILILSISIFAFTLTGCGGTVDSTNTDVSTLSSETTDISQQPDFLMDIKEKINPSLSEFTFNIYGKKIDGMYNLNKVIINESLNNKSIQQLDFESQTPNIEDMGVIIEDMNFDGYKDIRIQVLLPAGANIPYYCWLWDVASSQFEQNKQLEAISSPEFDAENKIIKSGVRDSAATYFDYEYRYVDGIPTLFRETERVADGDKKIWTITVRELVGEEMKVVKEYTEPLVE